MSASETPICDILEKLVARGLSPQESLDYLRPLEAAMFENKNKITKIRERERLKKQRQRARRKEASPPGTPEPGSSSTISLKTPESLKKEGKKDSDVMLSPGDDWQENYKERFWDTFPPARRYDKAQVYRHLEKLRADGFVNAEKKRERLTWATLWSGLERYVASNPGEFAKAPLPWLRAHRWQWDGGQHAKSSGENGRAGTDNYAAAAARRFGSASRNGPASGAGGPVQPPRRSGDERPGASGGSDAAFDFGNPPRR